MNRYVSSFLFACSVYIFLIGAIFYFLQTQKYIYKVDEKRVTAVMINVVPKVVKKESLSPKKESKPKEHKKIKKIKKLTKPKKRVKNVLAKKVVAKKPTAKKVISKKAMPQKVQSPTKIEQPKENLAKKRELYFLKIKQELQKHKIYPKMAIKRGVQGISKVTLYLAPDGKLINFRIDGKKIFNKSIEKAIKKTFPFPVKEGLLKENLTLHVNLVYRLF